MALIPLNQEVQVHKRSDGDAGLDEWGNMIPNEPITLKARVDEGSFVTTDKESTQTGKVAVAQVRVLLEGLADIGYDDEVEFVNELGYVVKKKPIRISVKRNFASKPELTEVLL
jgi:hypothetical protein